jgi:septal ring factor EnvC (AmiA/AmiB activator)
MLLLRGMVRMDMARRLNAYRVLSLALCSLVLVGWGAFADLRAELAQLKASQDQLLAERAQQQEAAEDLAQLQAKLASAREELAALDHKREQAKAQVAAVQQDRTELTKWLDSRRAKGPQKGSVSSSQAVE